MTDCAMANCTAEQRALLFLPLSAVPFASAAGLCARGRPCVASSVCL